MSAQHTPGPWIADLEPLDEDGRVFVYPRGNGDPNTRADICDVHAWHGAKARDANARLIAAAPDLLAALETLYEVAGGSGEQNAFAEACSKTRAAIAKAKGEV